MAQSRIKRTLPGFSRFSRPHRAIDPTTGLPFTGGNPSGIIVQDANGNDYYIWLDTNGVLRMMDAATVETAGFNFNTGGRPVATESISWAELASSVPVDIWIAPSPAIVISVQESHSVVGGAAAAVRPRKITDTSAPGAAASGTVKEITQAALDLTASINTVRSGTLSATASDYTFAAGDRLALNFTGTLTGLVGQITVAIGFLPF